MEKKQPATSTTPCPLGVCEKLFNAFHINSTFPAIRRLTFRQQEPVSLAPAANTSEPHPSPTPPPPPPQMPSHQDPSPAKKKPPTPEKHERARAPEVVMPPSKEKEKAVAVLMPVMSNVQEKGQPPKAPNGGNRLSKIPTAAGLPPANGNPTAKVLAVEPAPAPMEEKGQTAKPKKDINEKVDDFITRTKNKLKSSNSRLGRTSTTTTTK